MVKEKLRLEVNKSVTGVYEFVRLVCMSLYAW